MFKQSILALSISVISAQTLSAQAAPTEAELWKAIQQQQTTIDELKAKLEQTEKKLNSNTQQLNETDKKIEATADALDNSSTGSMSKTVIGGYGELHFNKWNNNLASGTDKDELDFHRFVLLIGHEFSDTVRFFSEMELEHAVAGEGKKGEVELEQAYIQWDFAANHNVKSGVFLVPVGIINETHEPDTFYGVERNTVENRIIPSTWWEGGAAVSGELAQGVSYDLAIHSGLSLPATKFQVRDGRQKVSEAKASDYAYTGRIKYTAIPGLELATSLQYQEDFWQSTGATRLGATLVEMHAVYQQGMFNLRALYAHWDIDSAINTVSAGAGADEQSGWYIEPSLRLTDQWGVFTRYSQWDNQAGDRSDSEYSDVSIGTNYWLTANTVVKLDVFEQSAPTGKDEFSGFNLGVGYSF